MHSDEKGIGEGESDRKNKVRNGTEIKPGRVNLLCSEVCLHEGDSHKIKVRPCCKSVCESTSGEAGEKKQ